MAHDDNDLLGNERMKGSILPTVVDSRLGTERGALLASGIYILAKRARDDDLSDTADLDDLGGIVRLPVLS